MTLPKRANLFAAALAPHSSARPPKLDPLVFPWQSTPHPSSHDAARGRKQLLARQGRPPNLPGWPLHGR
jgi:hypothetical protein